MQRGEWQRVVPAVPLLERAYIGGFLPSCLPDSIQLLPFQLAPCAFSRWLPASIGAPLPSMPLRNPLFATVPDGEGAFGEFLNDAQLFGDGLPGELPSVGGLAFENLPEAGHSRN